MDKIRPITLNELDHLGLDDEQRLYWKGQPVVTRQQVRLEAWVNVALVVGALSTAVIAGIEIARFVGAG